MCRVLTLEQLKMDMRTGLSIWKMELSRLVVPTFVSLLIPCKAIRAVGYPIADYFIWGDDTEYTTRITTNYATAYFVGKSKVLQELYNFMCKDEQLLKLNSNWV
jgi:hypothetical protein